MFNEIIFFLARIDQQGGNSRSSQSQHKSKKVMEVHCSKQIV